MRDRAGHWRAISAIGDVQLRGDELIGQNQTGVSFNGSHQYRQQLRLGVCLTA